MTTENTSLTTIFQNDKTLKELETKRDNLIDKLDTGAGLIQETKARCESAAELEDVWFGLLCEYEKTCESIRLRVEYLSQQQQQSKKNGVQKS